MARIYVKPQVRSSRSSRPRSLDYNVIEQIANGIEKMVVQWNHAKESRIIRPYTSGGGGGSRSSTAAGIFHSRPVTRPATATAAPSSAKSFEAGCPRAGDSSAALLTDGTTEMSIFLRGPGPMDKMVIPTLNGIVRAEVMKQCHEQLNGEAQVVNSAWYKSGAAASGSNNATDNGCLSARTDQVTTASEDDGITPRLESALERIRVLNNGSASTVQEMTKSLAASSSRELTGESKLETEEQQQQQQQQEESYNKALVECKGGNLEEISPGNLSERTESAFKTEAGYSDGTLDDSITPQVSVNQVDDWTDTSGAAGGENIRELITYSKKKEVVKEKEELLDDYKVKIEELQIALLECSTEYEVKIVEMKMMMLNMKSQYRQQMTTGNGSFKFVEPQEKAFSLVAGQQAKQNVEFLKKQMFKLKHDKENLSRELFNLKKKQRQSEKQKKSLDDALNKVSCLRRSAS